MTITGKIKTMVWYKYLENRAGVHTAYALEKLLTPEKFYKKNGATIRPCKIDKYKVGKHVPRKSMIDKAEAIWPGTGYWIEHPFWEIIKNDDIKIDKLHGQMARLHSGVSKLFFTDLSYGRSGYLTRNHLNIEDLDKLKNIGNFDALAGCIALIRESILLGDSFTQKFAAKFGLYLFKINITFFPFCVAQIPLYNYLKPYFLLSREHEQWNDYVESLDIEAQFLFHKMLINAVTKEGIISYSEEEHLFFLQNINKKISRDTVTEILKLRSSSQTHKISQLKDIKNFSRRLKLWRKKHIH